MHELPRLDVTDPETKTADPGASRLWAIEKTALQVLSGIRDLLPKAAILMASHRPIERDWAGRIVALG